MASTHFYYSPTAATGNAQITVSAATTNIGHNDSSATITFTNGVSSCTVDLVHRYKPYLTQGPTSIPATGGSLSAFVWSDYDIVFRSVPTWITVTLNGATIAEGQRVPASAITAGTGTTFILTAAPNTGAQRTIQYNGMNMCHYIGDTLMTAYTETIVGTQAPAEGISTDVNELVFEWNETSPKTFNVVTFESWTSSIQDD